jgi:hypothetical protein
MQRYTISLLIIFLTVVGLYVIDPRLSYGQGAVYVSPNTKDSQESEEPTKDPEPRKTVPYAVTPDLQKQNNKPIQNSNQFSQDYERARIDLQNREKRNSQTTLNLINRAQTINPEHIASNANMTETAQELGQIAAARRAGLMAQILEDRAAHEAPRAQILLTPDQKNSTPANTAVQKSTPPVVVRPEQDTQPARIFPWL